MAGVDELLCARKGKKQWPTLTTNVSFNRSSMVLPSRFLFLAPEEPGGPSLMLREVSEAGVRIPEREGG